jgi:hypothetical protein
MPQHAPNRPRCPHCDGFPTVAVTTGARHPDGTRITVRVTCPACQATGLGTAPARRPALQPAGR